MESPLSFPILSSCVSSIWKGTEFPAPNLLLVTAGVIGVSLSLSFSCEKLSTNKISDLKLTVMSQIYYHKKYTCIFTKVICLIQPQE